VLESIEDLIIICQNSPCFVVFVSLLGFILSGSVLLSFLELVARRSQMTDVLYYLIIHQHGS
jgi:hypothetical protein